MADIKCGVCAEPWENYQLRQEMNTPDNYVDLKAALGGQTLAGSGVTPYDHFMKGRGCPACKFGQHRPIFAGQTWVAKWEFHDYKTMSKIKGGEAFEVVLLDERSPDPFNREIILRRKEDGAEFTVKEKEFYPRFELVPDEAEKERQAEIFLDSAKSACSASDEDPLKILNERGLDF